MPGPWAPEIEATILDHAVDLVKNIRQAGGSALRPGP
jgi:hypothetical protein